MPRLEKEEARKKIHWQGQHKASRIKKPGVVMSQLCHKDHWRTGTPVQGLGEDGKLHVQI